MEPGTTLLANVAVAILLALGGGWLAVRLRLSPIVGYIVAGLLISPFTPGFAGDADRLGLVADVGIVLLLFAIGVQFSVTDLVRAGPRIVAAAAAQVALVMALAFGGVGVFGWSRDEALYVGSASAIMSSAVLVKLLEARGDIASGHGRDTIAWAIVQDIIAVVLIVVLGALSGEGEGSSNVFLDVGWAALKAAGFIVGVFVVGLRVVPFVLKRAADEGSRELFFLAVTGLAIGTALASEYVGLSLALGAFLAGMIISESDLSHRVLADLLPTRDVFAVLFFVAAGMLVDPAVLRDEWQQVLAVAACIVLVKPVASWLLLRAVGRPSERAVLGAVLLIPAGEFSFLLARAGLENGAINDDVFGVILAATVASIIVSPAAAALAYARVLDGPRGVATEVPPPSRLGRHAVVCGYERPGRIVASLLGPRFETLIVTDDARAARDARASGYEVIEGNPASTTIIERMRLGEARVLIITLSDLFATRLLSERARTLNPHLDVVGRAELASEAARLRRSGMSETVIAEDEVGYELARYGLKRFGLSSQEVLRVVQRARHT